MTGLVLAIIFLATLVSSTFGFGETLVAVPLLLLLLPSTTAVPLMVLLAATIALVVLIQDHRHVHFKSVKYLLLWAVFGIPVGLAIIIYGNESVIKIILAGCIISYALYSMLLTTPRRLAGSHRLWLFLCGFLSGVFGGAYGLSGPPVVVYGNMRRWSPQHFRATLQTYFLPVSCIILLGYFVKGLWTADIAHYYLLSLIVALPAILFGRFINSRITGEKFINAIYIGLIIVALVLLLDTIR